jgi:CRP-like cAMP-binding protein
VNQLSNIYDVERYSRQLTETVLFHGESVDWIRSWLARTDLEIREYDVGEYLFRKPDKNDHLGILLRGSADVSRVSKDGLMHMSILRKNDLYGAASLFGGDNAFVTDIRCMEKCRVLLISGEQILELLTENKLILCNYLRYLNGRIRFLSNRLDAFSKNSVGGKIMTYLSAESVDGVCRIKNYTKLSESLCVSRATLYRALDALESDGKIKRNGKEIMVLEEYEL